MFVRNHMTQNPVTVAPEASLREVIGLMTENRIRHVPVVDQANHVVGTISDHEIRVSAGCHGGQCLDRPACEVMSRDPITITNDATLCRALALLCKRDGDAILVLEADQLVGIMTRHDFMRAMVRTFGLHETGTCVEVSLMNPSEDLAVAFDVVRRMQTAVLSAIASCIRDDGAEPVLLLRLKGLDPGPIEKSMADAGLILLVPEEELADSASVENPGLSHPRMGG